MKTKELIEKKKAEIRDRWADEKEICAITGTALQTLRNDRFNGRGIPYTKNNKSIRYYLPDVYAYMEARRVSTSDAPAGRATA